LRKNLDNEKQFLSFSNFIRDTIKNSSEYIVNEFIGEISQDASNIIPRSWMTTPAGLNGKMIMILR